MIHVPYHSDLCHSQSDFNFELVKIGVLTRYIINLIIVLAVADLPAVQKSPETANDKDIGDKPERPQERQGKQGTA